MPDTGVLDTVADVEDGHGVMNVRGGKVTGEEESE